MLLGPSLAKLATCLIICTSSFIMISKFLRLPQAKQTTGLSKSTIYARIAEVTFPKQISLGPRFVVWVESDIQNWIAEQVSAARG